MCLNILNFKLEISRGEKLVRDVTAQFKQIINSGQRIGWIPVRRKVIRNINIRNALRTFKTSYEDKRKAHFAMLILCQTNSNTGRILS